VSLSETYCEPLCIICLAHAEQSLQRIVSRKEETGQVGEELSTKVEEDEEEIGCDKTEESVNLWDGSLLLEVVQDGVLGQLAESCG